MGEGGCSLIGWDWLKFTRLDVAPFDWLYTYVAFRDWLLHKGYLSYCIQGSHLVVMKVTRIA